MLFNLHKIQLSSSTYIDTLILKYKFNYYLIFIHCFYTHYYNIYFDDLLF